MVTMGRCDGSEGEKGRLRNQHHALVENEDPWRLKLYMAIFIMARDLTRCYSDTVRILALPLTLE